VAISTALALLAFLVWQRLFRRHGWTAKRIP
jgi:hypothetical protein